MNVSTENEAYAYDGQRVYIGGMRIVLYRLTPISKEDTEKIYRFGYNPFREYGEAVNIDKKNNKSMWALKKDFLKCDAALNIRACHHEKLYHGACPCSIWAEKNLPHMAGL